MLVTPVQLPGHEPATTLRCTGGGGAPGTQCSPVPSLQPAASSLLLFILTISTVPPPFPVFPAGNFVQVPSHEPAVTLRRTGGRGAAW